MYCAPERAIQGHPFGQLKVLDPKNIHATYEHRTSYGLEVTGKFKVFGHMENNSLPVIHSVLGHRIER